MILTGNILKKLKNSVLVFFYTNVFMALGRLLPGPFIHKFQIMKNSFAFKLYLHLLEIYMGITESFYKQDPIFFNLYNKKRFKIILKCALRTVWWRSYLGTAGGNLSLLGIENVLPVGRSNFIDVSKNDLLTISENDDSIVWRRSGGSTTGTPLKWGTYKGTIIINTLAPFIHELKSQGFPFESEKTKNFYIQFNYPHPPSASPFKWFLDSNFFLASDDPAFQEKIEGLARTINNISNCVIRSNPTELLFLTKEWKARGLKPKVSFCLVVGQIMEEEERRFIEGHLNSKVILHYGTQETGPLALECRTNRGFYHIFSERVILEILGEDGRPLPSGQIGQVSVTLFDNMVMPLIRYQPGDLGLIHENFFCRCGRGKVFLEIKRRTTDVFKFKDGREISAIPVLKQFVREPFLSQVRRFQVRQEGFGEALVLLELRGVVPPAFLSSLKKRLSFLYKNEINFRIEVVQKIETDKLKFKVFVSLVNI